MANKDMGGGGNVVSKIVVVKCFHGDGARLVWWLTLDSGLEMGVAVSVSWGLVGCTAVAARVGHGVRRVAGAPIPGP